MLKSSVILVYNGIMAEKVKYIQTDSISIDHFKPRGNNNLLLDRLKVFDPSLSASRQKIMYFLLYVLRGLL